MDVMYTMFVNNTLRLQWEHALQYLPNEELPPDLPEFIPSKEPTGALDAIESCRAILRDMYVVAKQRRCRIIGMALVASDCEYELLLMDRSSTPDMWRDYLRSIELLEYERMLANVPADSWLPVAQFTDVEIPLLHTEINNRITVQRRFDGVRNKRDQIGIARKQLQQLIDLCIEKGHITEAPPEKYELVNYTDEQVFLMNIDRDYDQLIDSVNKLEPALETVIDGGRIDHFVLHSQVVRLIHKHQNDTGAYVAKFLESQNGD